MNITTRISDTSWQLCEHLGWLKPGTRIYVAVSSFAEKDLCKNAGFRWNPTKKVWWTPDPNNAAKLSEWADITCQAELDAIRKENFKAVVESKAVETSMVIPCPEGLNYYGFQAAGIAYAMHRKNTLIGDDMGLGKTIQAIGVINCDETIKKVLVICPATLKTNWYREMSKWLIRKMRIGIVDSRICPLPEDGFNVTIINYDVITKHKKLKDINWDLLICDECFVAGSQVQTIRGDVPIEKISVGMEVENCLGNRKVIAVSKRITYETYEVEFYDGRKIEGTGDHPVFTNNGFKLLRTISRNSILIETKYKFGWLAWQT
jgi:hypothetical protein